MDTGELSWSRGRVEARLIAAFRRMPSCPVYTIGSRVKSVTDDENAMTSVLSWAGFLDHDPDGRKYLWAWARCKATRTSFGELCRSMGWPRNTAETGRRRGAEIIAARLAAAASCVSVATTLAPPIAPGSITCPQSDVETPTPTTHLDSGKDARGACRHITDACAG